jgi:hypothetical protein
MDGSIDRSPGDDFKRSWQGEIRTHHRARSERQFGPNTPELATTGAVGWGVLKAQTSRQPSPSVADAVANATVGHVAAEEWVPAPRELGKDWEDHHHRHSFAERTQAAAAVAAFGPAFGSYVAVAAYGACSC